MIDDVNPLRKINCIVRRDVRGDSEKNCFKEIFCHFEKNIK